MNPNERLSANEIGEQATEAMHIATKAVRQGLRREVRLSNVLIEEEIIASAILATSIIKLIAEGTIDKLEPQTNQNSSV